MIKTPKSLRLQIALLGRTNVGKSSLANLIAGQNAALVSPEPGTTSDVVEKSMELLPVGPVTLLDTAGVDDESALAEIRVGGSMKILDRADVAAIVVEPDVWTDYEERLFGELKDRKIPTIIAVNKIDLTNPSESFLESLPVESDRILEASSLATDRRDEFLAKFKQILLEIAPEDFARPAPILRDLVPPGGVCVMIVPIDKEAPKGRLILPQVQAIRDLLDGGSASLVVRETEYPEILSKLSSPPDLVVCDSQVVDKMVADTAQEVKCTTFSILFSRFKGDLEEEFRGAQKIAELKDGDKILIAEACSHHPNEDDIGRVKIPRLLRKYTGKRLEFEVYAGRDYPENVGDYDLIIHCGGCMITRREKLVRIAKATAAKAPITNYGIAISKTTGVLERVMSPFGL